MSPRTPRAVVAAAAALTLVSGTVALAAGPSSAPATGLQRADAVRPDLPSTATTPDGLAVENSFVSSTGWVKPGDEFPARVLLRNTGTGALDAGTVSIPTTKGMRFLSARPQAGVGTAAIDATTGGVTWDVGSLLPGQQAVLVLQEQALTAAEEPTIVWRSLATTLTLHRDGAEDVQAESHGPKVIPPHGGYETARYGDRPFPVVPVDYADAKHQPAHSAALLDSVINDPANPGSTFNLYQEMSYGQLFPKATVPSVGVASRPLAATDGVRFSTPSPTSTNTCLGVTAVSPTDGTPLPTYTARVTDGWYQLPGTRGYYGSDGKGSAVVGSLSGVGALQDIDSGCGPTAKAAYDAAAVADPDIDYSDYDTDKDGVVDFFEVIFQGCGGNGASQLGPVGGCEPTDTGDNIWPHSSSLENSYVDPETGLTGYVSGDQLKDLEGFPLWYTGTDRTTTTREDKGDDLKVFVRVGPYNVNPETAIDHASVISHEYGHSLGLPDYYSTGSRETYGDFTLMATDKSQNIDIVGKKELGWVVPEVLPDGPTTVQGWGDTKVDTGVIHWQTPDGTPYTLSNAGGDVGIHNGQAYVRSLPARPLLDPSISAPSGTRLWHSGSGNDFGCPPNGGHNLDVVIPNLDKVAPGTKVTASFTSLWDVEWDFDYGFVMAGSRDDKGAYSYTSLPSQKGYTTPAATNPNANACQAQFGNGLTGSSGAYAEDGANPVLLQADRTLGDYKQDTFVQDSYDLSSLVGKPGAVLRFSYATDPGLARKGWFIDDLVVKAGDTVLYSSDFEQPSEPALFPGGCAGDLRVAPTCTQGWKNVAAGEDSPLEHAYLLEMRDRSGFDFDGRGENDREAIAFTPGVLLSYTDESHGYGNVGTDDPPAQTPLDAKPEPESDAPDLSDATFDGTSGRSTFSDGGAGHVDNYTAPGADGAAGPWTLAHDCLSFTVGGLAGRTGNSADRYDLRGDVTFQGLTGKGCGAFDYGWRG